LDEECLGLCNPVSVWASGDPLALTQTTTTGGPSLGLGEDTFPRKEAPKAMVILLLAQVCNGEQCVPQVAFYLDSSHASTIFILCHCILQVMDAGLRTVLW